MIIFKSYNKTIFGEIIHLFGPVKSTQHEARKILSVRKPPFLVIADEQTNGYGRRGSKWLSPPGGLYLTWVTKNVEQLGVTLVIALAIAKTVDRFTDGKVIIKWPNDVFILDKKCAGVIAELEGENLLIGVGINTGKSPEPEEFAALNLSAPERMYFFRVFLEMLAPLWPEFVQNGLKSILDEYNEYALPKGSFITTHAGDEVVHGEIIEVTERGSLLIKTKTGTRELTAGKIINST